MPMALYLWKEWSIVVDVLEVDLNIGVAHQPVTAVVLGKDGESPLGPATRFITIEGLKLDYRLEH